MSAEVWVCEPGLVPYREALATQKRLEAARQAGRIPDVLLLLEHPPVYTKGRRSGPGDLPMGEEWYAAQGIEVVATDRGGQVTYHGPGQLVAYPIVDLGPLGGDVQAYVRGLERVMIATLAEFGVAAQVIAGLTGVWTAGRPPLAAGDVGPQRTPVGEPALDGPGEARKVGSIGVHVNRQVTTHGLAVNVNNDLQPFEWVVPCGIEAARMTSLCRELGAEQDLAAFAAAVRDRFCETFDRDPVALDPADLDRVAPSPPSGAGTRNAGSATPPQAERARRPGALR